MPQEEDAPRLPEHLRRALKGAQKRGEEGTQAHTARRRLTKGIPQGRELTEDAPKEEEEKG